MEILQTKKNLANVELGLFVRKQIKLGQHLIHINARYHFSHKMNRFMIYVRLIHSKYKRVPEHL